MEVQLISEFQDKLKIGIHTYSTKLYHQTLELILDLFQRITENGLRYLMVMTKYWTRITSKGLHLI